MAGMGPAPKDASQRRRRNATPGTKSLPAEGRTQRAPVFPLGADVALSVKANLARQRADRAHEQLLQVRESGEGGPAGERAAEERWESVETRAQILETQRDSLDKMERALWREVWKTPQATQWERLRWTRDVAQYVRLKALGELGDLNSAKEARQWSDRLGLSPMSLLRLRWEIPEKRVLTVVPDSDRSNVHDLLG